MTIKDLKEKVSWTYFAVPNGIEPSAWLSNMLHDYETNDIDKLKRYMYDCGEPRRAYSIIYCCAYDVSDNCTYFGYGTTRQIALRDLYKQVR